MITTESRLGMSGNEVFRLMIEESPLPVSIQNASWEFVYVNQAYCDYVGYPADRLIGRDPSDFLFPSESIWRLTGKRREVDRIFPAAQTLPDYGRVRELIRGDGTRVRFQAALGHSTSDEGTDLWCGVLFDLTELAETQAALDSNRRESANMQIRFDTFSELSNEGLLVVEPFRDRVLHANSVVADIFGVESKDLSSTKLSSLLVHVDEQDLPFVQSMIGGRDSRRGSETTVLLAHPAAGRRTLRIRAFRDARPQAETFMLVEDITEHIRHEEQRLRVEVMRREVLVREIHHRIKNNLQLVVGLLESAKRSGQEKECALDSAIHKIDAIAAVNGLLTDGGPTVPLLSLVENLTGYFSDVFEHPVDVVSSLGAYRPSLSIDVDAVPAALVLNELLTNAVKHAIRGSTVQVLLSRSDDGVLIEFVNAAEAPGEFSLTDSGESSHGLGLVKALLDGTDSQLSATALEGAIKVSLILGAGLLSQEPSS